MCYSPKGTLATKENRISNEKDKTQSADTWMITLKYIHFFFAPFFFFHSFFLHHFCILNVSVLYTLVKRCLLKLKEFRVLKIIYKENV